MSLRGLVIAVLLATLQSLQKQPTRTRPLSRQRCFIEKGSFDSVCSSSQIPETPRGRAGKSFSKNLLGTLLSTALVTATNVKLSNADVVTVTPESTYKDNANGFSLLVEPGWSVMPRKTPPTTMLQYLSEEVLFTGSRFNEGGGASSLSVTRSNAARLLKDFNVEWWFAPLNTMNDLGSADLIAGLLILQRQGEVSFRGGVTFVIIAFTSLTLTGTRYELTQFEKKESPSSVKNAKIVDNVLTFDFTTPLGSIYVRRTDVKALLRDNKLMVVWISALTTFWEGEYAEKLTQIKDSFTLIDIQRRAIS